LEVFPGAPIPVSSTNALLSAASALTITPTFSSSVLLSFIVLIQLLFLHSPFARSTSSCISSHEFRASSSIIIFNLQRIFELDAELLFLFLNVPPLFRVVYLGKYSALFLLRSIRVPIPT